jgi:formate dehydrogenase subunit gamma
MMTLVTKQHLRVQLKRTYAPPSPDTGIQNMQAAEVVHGIVAMLFIAAMIAHIYIGTIGMEGAFEAMGTGTIDINWAKEHHNLWLDEEKARTSPNEIQRRPTRRPLA